MHTISYILPFDDTNARLRISVTVETISRLIEESQRSKVLVVNLNSEILENLIELQHNIGISIQLSDLKGLKFSDNQKIGATILHLVNYDEFDQFYVEIRTEKFFHDGYFIIIYEGDDVDEIEKMFSKFWRVHIYNVNVLVLNSNSSNLMSVFTYMPFSNESCGNTKPIQINEFDKSSMKWMTNEFFPKKFNQLNRCPIRFGCYEYNPDIVIHRNVSGSKEIAGVIVDIGMMFSDILNFTLNLIEYEQGTGTVFKNKTATALLSRLLKNEIDLIFGSLQIDRVDTFSATRTVHTDKIILVVPPPFLIDPIKKIFLPFTFASWISIGMVALLACCVVKVLKFTPSIVHDYVIGRNVKGTMLNICNIFLGGTQQILPRSNFPRFLLMKFMLFTLIMRSLYQGGVFHILKEDVNTKGLDTFDEFIEHEFTFYIYKSLARRLAGTRLTQRFVEFIINHPAAKRMVRFHSFIQC